MTRVNLSCVLLGCSTLLALTSCRPAAAPPTVAAAPEQAASPAVAEASPPAPRAEPPLAAADPVEEPVGPPALSDGSPVGECGSEVANMSCVLGGVFTLGSDDGPENARPARQVELHTFYMDKFEVTYKQYKTCWRAGDCPKGGPFYLDFNRPHQSINGVTWHGAKKYCEVMGKHLPTEAQWEAAARGPDAEVFPWGNEPATCKLAVIRDGRGRSCGVEKRGTENWKGRPFIVGSRPPQRYGLYDMAGNSWEYVADWFSPSFAECGEACTGIDPRGPCEGAEKCEGHNDKLVKGGSWYWRSEYASGYYRRPQSPRNRPFHHFGFRCAASADEAKTLQGKPLPETAPTEGMKNADSSLG